MYSRNPNSIFPHHLRQQHKHVCLTSARAPSLPQFGLSATFACSPRSFSSASPRLRHLYLGEEETSSIAKLRPQVSLFIGYAVPVGYLLLDRYPTGTGMGKNLYPRQLTGTGAGWIFRSGEENVPAIPDGYILVAILNQTWPISYKITPFCHISTFFSREHISTSISCSDH